MQKQYRISDAFSRLDIRITSKNHVIVELQKMGGGGG